MISAMLLIIAVGMATLGAGIFGGSEIDFRQAELEEGITQVVALSIFGANKLVVPQDMPVTLSGFSMLGARADERSQAKEPPASAKALQINAINIFGGFTLTE